MGLKSYRFHQQCDSCRALFFRLSVFIVFGPRLRVLDLAWRLGETLVLLMIDLFATVSNYQVADERKSGFEVFMFL